MLPLITYQSFTHSINNIKHFLREREGKVVIKYFQCKKSQTKHLGIPDAVWISEVFCNYWYELHNVFLGIYCEYFISCYLLLTYRTSLSTAF